MVIFMPFAFTKTCLGEMCTLRDNLHHLEASGAKFVVITCDTRHSDRRWAQDQGFDFPILSELLAHGEVSRAYGFFNEAIGASVRATFVLDENGVVTEIISTDRLDVPRDFGEYERAFGSLPRHAFGPVRRGKGPRPQEGGQGLARTRYQVPRFS